MINNDNKKENLKMGIYEELVARGLIAQVTDEDRRIALCTGRSEKTSGASDDSKPGIQEEVQF